MKIVAKIIVALLSAVILGVLMASFGYTSEPRWQSGSYYTSFESLFVLYATLSAVAYVMGGLPYSLLADLALKKVKRGLSVRYAARFGLYAIGGLLVMFLFMPIFFGGTLFTGFDDSTGRFLGLGVTASLLFMHVELLLKLIWTGKLQRQK